MLLSIKFEIWNIYLAVILVIFSIGTIAKYAPVENKNKPLEKIERKIYRKRLIAIIYGLMFINFILILLNLSSISFSISFSFCLSAIMILFCYSSINITILKILILILRRSKNRQINILSILLMIGNDQLF